MEPSAGTSWSTCWIRAASVVAWWQAVPPVPAWLAPLFQKHGDRLRLVIGDLRRSSTLSASWTRTGSHLRRGVARHARGGLSRVDLADPVHQNLPRRRPRRARPRAEAVRVHVEPRGRRPLGQRHADDRGHRVPTVSWYGTAEDRRCGGMVHTPQAGELPVTIVRPVAVYGEGEKNMSRSTCRVPAGLQPPDRTAEPGDVVRLRRRPRPRHGGGRRRPGRRRRHSLWDRNRAPPAAAADAMNQPIRVPMVTPPIALRGAAVLQEWLHPFARSRPLASTQTRCASWRDRLGSRAAAARRPTCAGAPAERSRRTSAARCATRTSAAGARPSWPGPRAADQVIQTFTLAVLVGVIFEGLAWLAGRGLARSAVGDLRRHVRGSSAG